MDIGARLRQARETRGLTIDALSKSTRVQPRILSAIERNDSVSIPPRPYGRGFVRAYASEVGLDPDGTVRDFFSQFGLANDSTTGVPPHATVAASREPTPNPWVWPVGTVLGYALVGTLVILGGRLAFQGKGETGAVGTTGSAVPPVTAPVERQPVAVPAPPPPALGVTVLLEARQPSWVEATVDGQQTMYRMVQQGDRINVKGTRQIRLRIGDAGAVVWQINGGASVPMGQPGRVRTVVITPENAGQIK